MLFRSSQFPDAYSGLYDADIAEIGFLSMGLVLVSTTALIYARRNARRDAERHEADEGGISVQYSEEELKRMGDRAPGFRYTL